MFIVIIWVLSILVGYNLNIHGIQIAIFVSNYMWSYYGHTMIR